MHILLVEPDVVLAKIYSRAFEDAGWSVSHATHAQAAIDAADEKAPDVVVLELQLSQHGGVEFLYEFRSYDEWQTIPVVVHSMVPMTDFGLESLLKKELGVQQYYYKLNTSITQLMVAIREYVAIEQ